MVRVRSCLPLDSAARSSLMATPVKRRVESPERVRWSRRVEGSPRRDDFAPIRIFMTEISVTLPDGSSRRMPAGVYAWRRGGAISPRLAKAALAAVVDGRLVDLTYPLAATPRSRIVTAGEPRGAGVYRHSTAHLLAAAVTKLFPGTQCGIGPATDEGFFYDFVVERPFVPEDLEAIEKKMKELAAQDLPYERQMWPRDEAIEFFSKKGEPLKVQLIEEKTEGQAEVSVLHDQGSRHVRGLLRRAARAVDRPAEGVQAADHVERVLEGRRAKPADAARLRHRVLQRQGAEGAPAARSRKRRSATIASSGRSSACSCSTRGRRAPRSGSRRARCSTTCSPTTCERC